MDGINEENKTGMSALHQYCTKYKLEYPCYKIIEVTDLTNSKIFMVQCILKDQIETRTGKNKRQAKNLAAHYLLERLKYRALFSCRDYMNDKDEDSLEEGEIDDREEGEIIEGMTNKKSENNIDKKEDRQKNNEIDDDILFYENKIAQYKCKKVYLEGNVKQNNINFVNNLQNKTQLQLLAEFCFENKLPSPIYEINEHIGLTTQIFTCQCSVLQLKMRTSGISKEDVKERSSMMLLAKMKKHINILKSSDDGGKKMDKNELEEGEIPENMSHQNGCNSNNLGNRKKRRKFEKNESSDRNPLFLHNYPSMGDLYNYCLKQQIPPPNYKVLEKKDVAPNKKVFTVQCSVLKFSKISYGLNKRQAKHRAARLVLDKLQDWNKEDVQDRESDLEEGEITEKDEVVKQEYVKRRMENNYISRNEKNLLQLESISDRHNIMKKSTPYTDCKTLNSLKMLDDSDVKEKIDATLLLNKICEEMDITYDFVDFKSDLNSMVSLFVNSVPPWSTFGVGKIKEEAKLDAIRKIIKFLKEMIKN